MTTSMLLLLCVFFFFLFWLVKVLNVVPCCYETTLDDPFELDRGPPLDDTTPEQSIRPIKNDTFRLSECLETDRTYLQSREREEKTLNKTGKTSIPQQSDGSVMYCCGIPTLFSILKSHFLSFFIWKKMTNESISIRFGSSHLWWEWPQTEDGLIGSNNKMMPEREMGLDGGSLFLFSFPFSRAGFFSLPRSHRFGSTFNLHLPRLWLSNGAVQLSARGEERRDGQSILSFRS